MIYHSTILVFRTAEHLMQGIWETNLDSLIMEIQETKI